MQPQIYSLASYAVMLAVFTAFAVIVLQKLTKVDLSDMLCESPPAGAMPGMPPVPGKASISRFQLLLFTFLIGGLFVVLSLEAGTFVEIPNGVLGLLGISGGSFLISKGLPK